MSHNKNKFLIELAESAVENYIKERKIISPPRNLPKEFLTKKSGVFVTIEKGGSLRGCIGT
jgi:AMMECR1 domain-containing protein